MCHRVGVDWCIRQYLGQLSVYILVTIHRSSVKQSVDWVSIALVVCQQWTYQWAISWVPIRYRRCNIWSTIFITCTIFFSNQGADTWLISYMYQITGNFHISTNILVICRSTYHYCYWSSVGRESVKSQSMSYGSWSRYWL